MSQEFALFILTRSVTTAILLSAPILIVGLVIGVVVSIFQAATSIQEMTLTFIPKMIAVLGVLILGLPWMMNLMISYTQEIFSLLITASH